MPDDPNQKPPASAAAELYGHEGKERQPDTYGQGPSYQKSGDPAAASKRFGYNDPAAAKDKYGHPDPPGYVSEASKKYGKN